MASEGEVTYELRGDDSNLDGDLAKAEKKVEEHARKTEDVSVSTNCRIEKSAKDANENIAKASKTAHRSIQEDFKFTEKISNSLNKELSTIDGLLKFDPQNTELLQQKTALLSKAVEETKDRLQKLRGAQEEVQKAFDSGNMGESEYRAFRREIIAAEQELTRFSNELDGVSSVFDKSSQKTAKTFKSLAKDFSADVRATVTKAKESASKALTAIRHPVRTLATYSADKTQNIRQSFKEAFQRSKEHAISGMEKVADAILHPVKTAKTAAASIKESFKGAMDKVGSLVETAGKAGVKAIGAGLLSAGAAVGVAGAAAVKGAVDMDKAVNGFLASTGKSAAEAEKYQGVLEGIYKNNYGEDFGDIAQAMGLVEKQLGEMDGESLQTVTESAFALRDVFEYDIAESTRAAKAMMDNFGVSGDKAMSMIAAGAQNGLDYSGELIDSISEYSVQFAKVGLDADDMFKIFQKGTETGAWNLDKIGDAVKEMSIRVIDGSDTTAAGFEALGLNADEIVGKFSKGGESAKEAFQETIAALAAMEDPLAQNTAGVNLFGTMWEDLGPEVVTQLADIEKGAYDTADAMDGIKKVKYDDLGSMFEGLKRSVELLLIPLGEQLIPVFSELIEAAMPIIEEVIPPLTEAVGEVITELSPLIEEILPVISELIGELLPPLMDIISAVLPVLTELVSTLLPPLMEIISDVLPVLLELVNALLPLFTTITELLKPVIDLFMQLLAPILNLISQALVPLVNAITPLINMIVSGLIPVLNELSGVFLAVFSGILSTVSGVMGNLTNIFNNIVSFIKNVFTGNWKGAWENIKNIFKNIVEGLGNIFKSPINAIIDLINGFIGGLNKIKIPDWVPVVGGKGIDLPTIPRLRVGMDYVPSDDFPAILHKGEAVLTAQENALYQANGGLNGVIRNLEQPPEKKDFEIDYDRLAQAMAKAMPDPVVVLEKGSITGKVSIDGKYAGTILAPVIDKKLEEIKKGKERS